MTTSSLVRPSGEIFNRVHSTGNVETMPYLHKNPLVRWIFWKRLQKICDGLPTQKGSVLDFGTGSGVLLPSLAEAFDHVHAVDLFPEGAKRMVQEMGLESRVSVTQGREDFTLDFPDASMEAIVAADVLEHLTDRQPVLKEFVRILKPGGVFVLSGPTENFMYRLSRRVVFWFFGKKHDHFTNVFELEKEVDAHLNVEKRWVLPNKWVQGFVVFSARKPA